MRELVFNEASLGQEEVSREAIAGAVADLIAGLKILVAQGVAERSIRLPANATEMIVCRGTTLYDVLFTLMRDASTKDRGVFFATLAQKAPVDADLDETTIDTLLQHQIEDLPNTFGLLLCALTDKIAVSVCLDSTWDRDQIEAFLLTEAMNGTILRERKLIDHLGREGHAGLIVARARSAQADELPQTRFWEERQHVFPRLRFGLDVKGQVQKVDPEIYQSALSRLKELEEAAERWEGIGGPVPPYLSKVTGESLATMNRFRKERVFRDARGEHQTFERHARIANGFRIHLIEHGGEREIEIGYIGPHLPVAKKG